jgi:hypothetical protein
MSLESVSGSVEEIQTSMTKENTVTCAGRLVFDETEAKAWHPLPQLFGKVRIFTQNEHTYTSTGYCTRNIDAIDKLIGAKEWSQPGLEPGASRN